MASLSLNEQSNVLATSAITHCSAVAFCSDNKAFMTHIKGGKGSNINAAFTEELLKHSRKHPDQPTSLYMYAPFAEDMSSAEPYINELLEIFPNAHIQWIQPTEKFSTTFMIKVNPNGGFLFGQGSSDKETKKTFQDPFFNGVLPPKK